MRLTSVSRPGTLAGSSRRHSSTASSGVVFGPELHTDRVLHAGEEVHVRAVELARALADPEQVRAEQSYQSPVMRVARACSASS